MDDLNSHGIIALVKNQEGKYLLLEAAREPMKGFWAPPHGLRKASDESEESAVIREVYEETRLPVSPIKKLFTKSTDTKFDIISFWEVITDKSKIFLNEESSAYGWFTIEEALVLNLHPSTKTFFETMVS